MMWPSSSPAKFFQEFPSSTIFNQRQEQNYVQNDDFAPINRPSFFIVKKKVQAVKWSKKNSLESTHDAKGRHFIFTQELLSL